MAPGWVRHNNGKVTTPDSEWVLSWGSVSDGFLILENRGAGKVGEPVFIQPVH